MGVFTIGIHATQEIPIISMDEHGQPVYPAVARAVGMPAVAGCPL